jgi:hypothetical protein
MMQEMQSQTREVYLSVGCGTIISIDVPKDMTEERVRADFAYGQLIVVALALPIYVLILAALSFF